MVAAHRKTAYVARINLLRLADSQIFRTERFKSATSQSFKRVTNTELELKIQVYELANGRLDDREVFTDFDELESSTCAMIPSHSSLVAGIPSFSNL